jgi:hypothetical protein
LLPRFPDPLPGLAHWRTPGTHCLAIPHLLLLSVCAGVLGTASRDAVPLPAQNERAPARGAEALMKGGRQPRGESRGRPSQFKLESLALIASKLGSSFGVGVCSAY